MVEYITREKSEGELEEEFKKVLEFYFNSKDCKDNNLNRIFGNRYEGFPTLVEVTGVKSTTASESFTSRIDRHTIDYLISKDNYKYQKGLTRLILSKEYYTRMVVDLYTGAKENEPYIREKDVLKILSDETPAVPPVYHIDGRKIYMHDVMGDLGQTFKNKFDSLDQTSLKLLARIIKSGQLSQEELEKEFGGGVALLIKRLEQRGYLEIKYSGNVKRPTLFGGSLSRFTILKSSQKYFPIQKKRDSYYDVEEQNGVLVLKESDYFKNLRIRLMGQTLFRLMEIQFVGNKRREDLEKAGVRQFTLDEQIRVDERYLQNLISFEEGKSFRIEKFHEKGPEIKKALNDLNMPVTSKNNILLMQFLHGDAYPENIIERHKNIRLIDFFNAHFGPWMFDVVDFIDYYTAQRTITQEQQENLYTRAKTLKIGYVSDEDLKKRIVNEFDRHLSIMRVKRSLRNAAVLSHLVYTYRNNNGKRKTIIAKMDPIEIEGRIQEYDTRRVAYLKHLRKIINHCEEAKSLEEILMPYLERYST